MFIRETAYEHENAQLGKNIYSPGRGHMISNGETSSTNEKRSRVAIDSKLPSRPGSLTRFGAG